MYPVHMISVMHCCLKAASLKNGSHCGNTEKSDEPTVVWVQFLGRWQSCALITSINTLPLEIDPYNLTQPLSHCVPWVVGKGSHQRGGGLFGRYLAAPESDTMAVIEAPVRENTNQDNDS